MQLEKDLKKGKDDLEYIEQAVRDKNRHKALLSHLREKYDYRNKKVIYPNRVSKEKFDQLKEQNKNDFIFGFDSHFEKQLEEKRAKVSKFELLRAHVKNYQMLTPKEKRSVLGYIGARRSRDARKQFRKELSLLAQKIVYESKQAQEQEHQSYM